MWQLVYEQIPNTREPGGERGLQSARASVSFVPLSHRIGPPCPDAGDIGLVAPLHSQPEATQPTPGLAASSTPNAAARRLRVAVAVILGSESGKQQGSC